jgi:hypothetical protein
MPEMHHLKANDFILENKWEPIETFPREATTQTFEVRDEHGEVWLARWFGGRILVDGDSRAKLLHWRPTS